MTILLAHSLASDHAVLTATQPVPGFSSGPAGAVDDFLYSGVVAVTFTF